MQQFYQKMIVGNLGPEQNLDQQTKYINFYANLIKKSDEFLVRAARRMGNAAWAAGQPRSWSGTACALCGVAQSRAMQRHGAALAPWCTCAHTPHIGVRAPCRSTPSTRWTRWG